MKIITLFLITILTSFAQEKNISVIYGKRGVNLSQLKNQDPNFLSRVKKIHQSYKGIEYELVVNNNESSFSYIEKMSNDGLKVNRRSVASGNMGSKHYSNINNDERLESLDFLGEDFILKTPIKKYNWKISSDKKTINNYKCYKASTTVTIDDFRGKSSHKIIVWFTPDLAFPFGPANYFGELPGLVLEVNYNNRIIIYAKKIVFKSDKRITKPSKGKIITEKEYKEMAIKAYEKLTKGA